jgi:hypothetical protein
MMTKNKSKHLAILTVGLLCAGAAQAQQASTAAGGDFSGSGGTVAYSVGQIVYTTHTGINGSVAQGVQQPYEISIVFGNGIVDNAINLELFAYPNPTQDFVQLKIESGELQDLSYQLVDITGRMLASQKIQGATETILMKHLPSATYFLKVTYDNKLVKTFKIIKN